MKATKAERAAQAARTDHDFIIGQGARRNDYRFIIGQKNAHSTPTQHGLHLMRSHLEAMWAAHFERRGFVQAPIDASEPYVVPCYYYEPYGGKRWPSYPAKKHYRIDFALVYEIVPYLWMDKQLHRAKRWEWVSIKPTTVFDADRRYLAELVQFDSLHQRAFQLCGPPTEQHRVYSIVYDAPSQSCRTSWIDRERAE